MTSLDGLPIEFVYRILDHLDQFDILCSMKNVSLRLNNIIDTYPRYQTFTTWEIRNKQLATRNNLANAFKDNKIITTVKIISEIGYDSNIEHDGVEYLFHLLRNNNSTITTLEFEGNKINDVEVEHLVDALKTNTTLTKLKISGCPFNTITIGPVGAQHLANVLKINTTLTSLDIRNNSVKDIGTKYLADALKINKTLTTLNLGFNQFGDIGAQGLADALRTNTILTTLIINTNEITDVGTKYLADALKTNKTFMMLNLISNSITDVGAEYLADALRTNIVLTTLELDYNIITNIGANYFANASINSKIVLDLSTSCLFDD